MSYLKKTLTSSLVKKYVMAVTGFALASFLLIHMLGNLQAFEGGPHAINVYAYTLQNLPWEILWGFRIGLGLMFVFHFFLAYLIRLENWKSRPQGYSVKRLVEASCCARTMVYTGTLILLFAVFHILHYTALVIDPEFQRMEWLCETGIYKGTVMHDVYAMLIIGFSNNWISAFYIIAMIAIGAHLTHGVTSMFNSVGLRNERVRYALNCAAILYAVVVFGGFAIQPGIVLLGKYTPVQIMPVKEVLSQYEAVKNQPGDIFIDYGFLGHDESAKDNAPHANPAL